MEKFGEPALYNDKVHLSRTEARWGAYFDAAGIAAVHEPQTFLVDIGLASTSYHLYTPDFVLPEHGNTYVEVKNGPIYMDEVLKAMHLARGVGNGVLLLNGSPQNMSVYCFYPNSRKPFRCPLGVEGYAAANADSMFYSNRHLLVGSPRQQELIDAIRSHIARANEQEFTRPTQTQLDAYYKQKSHMHARAEQLPRR